MKFTLTTEKGTNLQIEAGTSVVIEIDGVKYEIIINKLI